MNMKIAQQHLHKLQQELMQQESLVNALAPDDKARGASSLIRFQPTRSTESSTNPGELFAEKNEMQRKRDEQRALSRGQQRGKFIQSKITRLSELYGLLESRNTPAQQRQEQALQDLLVNQREPDAQQLLDAAGGDPVLADTLLRIALSKAQRLENDDLAASISHALQTLKGDFSAQITAGCNTAVAIATFTTHPEQKMAMRQLYYSVVIEQQSAELIFDSLLEQFGFAEFEPAMRTLQRALSDDIAAFSSSVSRKALRHILSGLDDTRAITHTLASVQAFLDRLKTRHPQVTIGAETFTRSLLSMCNKGFQSHEVTRLAPEVVGQQPLHQSMFYNQFLTLVQSLPQKLWGRDESNRNKAILMLRTLNGEYAAWEKRFAQDPQ